MDPLLHLAETRRFFTRAEARDAAYDDKAVASAVRARAWHRIRRGYFTFQHLWAAAGPEDRHRIRSAAVLHSLGDRVALSHVSAVLHHRIDVWDLPLERVHVTRLDGGPGRVEGDVVHHEGVASDADVIEVDGLRTVTPARAALEAASRAPSGAAALVVLDALLRTHPGAPLAAQFDLMQRWPFMRSLHIPARMADGRSGSAGESVGRWVIRGAGIPEPVLQLPVPRADGTLVGTCDWGWPGHRLLGEFDGRIKYGRLLSPGQEPGDVVFAEKRREDEMREVTGYAMIRFVWDDWSRPRLAAERLRRALRLAG